MAMAFICVRCHGCEETQNYRRVERINGRPYCRPCAKRLRAETCPDCGHMMLDVHTPFGCLFEISDTAFCPCQPEAFGQAEREGRA